MHWDVWADYYFDPSELKQYDSSGNLTIIPVGEYLDLRRPILNSVQLQSGHADILDPR